MSSGILDREALIQSSNRVEPLPATTTRLAAIVARDDWDMAEIEAVVMLDPTLTARLLRAANSAAGAANHRIGSVHEAAIRLGPGTVVALSVAAFVGPAMRTAIPEYGLAQNALWAHSVTAALAAEMSRTVASSRVPAESYTAALLHDFGKLILARFLDSKLLESLERAQADGQLDAMEAEWQVLEVHHGEIGGLVAEHWQLPESIINAIIHHHTPDEIAEPTCDVVHLADKVANALSVSDDASALAVVENELSAAAVRRLGLRDGGFTTLTERVRDRFDDLVKRYR